MRVQLVAVMGQPFLVCKLRDDEANNVAVWRWFKSVSGLYKPLGPLAIAGPGREGGWRFRGVIAGGLEGVEPA